MEERWVKFRQRWWYGSRGHFVAMGTFALAGLVIFAVGLWSVSRPPVMRNDLTPVGLLIGPVFVLLALVGAVGRLRHGPPLPGRHVDDGN